MAEFQTHIKSLSMLNLWLYYGMKTVGKLFFAVGTLFCLMLWVILSNEVNAEARKFMMLFAVIAGCFAAGGALMLAASWFMKKPAVPENDSGVHAVARIMRVVSIIGMLLTVLGGLPLAVLFFFVADTRDWLPWQDVPETGTCVSCEDSRVYVGDSPMKWCRFSVKTPQGEEVTWESYSREPFDKTAAVPLQRWGSRYRARGCTFGILDLTSSVILAGMLMMYLIVFMICLQGFLKLHRFLKATSRTEAQPPPMPSPQE